MIKKINIILFFILSGLSLQAQSDTETSQTVGIVGGEIVESGEYPWMVGLIAAFSEDFKIPVCGASLIAPQWVLTAGHCAAGGAFAPPPTAVHINTLTQVPPGQADSCLLYTSPSPRD